MNTKSCPNCKSTMTFIGSIGICDYDGRWESQSDRHRCTKCNIMVFIASADEIDEAELMSLEAEDEQRLRDDNLLGD